MPSIQAPVSQSAIRSAFCATRRIVRPHFGHLVAKPAIDALMRADVSPHLLELARLITLQQIPVTPHARRCWRSLRSLRRAQRALPVRRCCDAQHLARGVAKLRISAVAGTRIEPARILQAVLGIGPNADLTQKIENLHQYPVLAVHDPEALVEIVERHAKSTGKRRLDCHMPREQILILDRRQEHGHRIRRRDLEERMSYRDPHGLQSAVLP